LFHALHLYNDHSSLLLLLLLLPLSVAHPIPSNNIN
jgi:hypothetical protein